MNVQRVRAWVSRLLYSQSLWSFSLPLQPGNPSGELQVWMTWVVGLRVVRSEYTSTLQHFLFFSELSQVECIYPVVIAHVIHPHFLELVHGIIIWLFHTVQNRSSFFIFISLSLCMWRQ